VIENEAPVFHGIFNVAGQRAEEKEMVLLQVNYFVKGCPNCVSCDTYQVFGGEDPDGDTVYYEWHIRRDGATKEDAVYDMRGNRVDGVPTAGDCFVWFPMWQEHEPLLPMGLVAQRVSSLDEADSLNLAGLSPMGFYRTYTVKVIVSDCFGASNTFTTKWEVLEMDN
jgi:hypothetical protein